MKECFEKGYDVLINTTPNPMPIDSNYIIPKSVVMDIITRPKETLLLKEAHEKGCSIIYGYKMFIEQALGQYSIWFKDRINLTSATEILESLTASFFEQNS